MNFNDLFTLFLEGLFVAGIVLILFRLRKNLGLGILYACLAIYQFIQIIIFFLNTVYETTLSTFFVSPGSSFFITVTLFSFLIIYVKEGAKELKKITYAILIVNILITILALDFTSNLQNYNLENSLSNPNEFIFTARILFFGNSVLFIDSFLLILIFEYIAKKTKSLFIQILLTMLLVVSIDTLLFSITTFWNLNNLNSILIRSLIAKNSFALFYSVLFYIYLKYFDYKDKDLLYIKTKDVYKPLTFKQKFIDALQHVKKSEELYSILTNNSKDIICLLDTNGIYKYVSPSIKPILGYEQDTFLGKNIFSIVHQKDIELLKKQINDKEFNNKNNNNPFIFRLKHIKGHYLWIEYNISPIYKENKLTSYVSSARDVTKRVLADQQFKKSSKLLKIREQFLNESSKIGKIGFLEYLDKNKTWNSSDYIFTIFGLESTSDYFKTGQFLSFFDENSSQKIRLGIEKLYADGKTFKSELKAKNVRGEEIWISVIINPIFDKNKKVIGRRAILQDITDYKNTQFQLKKSKKEIENSFKLLKEKDNSLKQTSEIAKIGYWEYNIKSDSFSVSNYVYTIYGLKPNKQSPSRDNILNFFDNDSKEKYVNVINNLKNVNESFDLELKIHNTKNEEVWVRIVGQTVKDSNNNITGRQGIIQNITETKNYRLALEKSNLEIKNSIKLIEQKESYLKETRKLAKLGYSEYKFDTKSYIWTDFMYTIFGLNPEEKIPSRENLIALYDNESKLKLEKATKELDANGTPYDIELKLINFKKEEVWVRIVAHLIYNKNNKVIGRNGVFRDITTYKNNQLKLKSYLKQLELKDIALKESNRIANIGYWEYYFEKNVSTYSNYVYEILGLNYDVEIPDQEQILQLFDGEHLQKIEEATLKLMRTGKPYDIEAKLINFQKSEIWTRNIVQPIINSENKIIGRRGFIQNITDYKKTQIALENSLEILAKKELSLKDSSNMAGIGYIEYDYTKKRYEEYSSYVYKIFGLKPGEELNKKENVISYFDKESQVKFLQSFETVKKGQISDVELKGKNRNNEDIWIRCVSSPIFNDKQEVIKRRVVIQNIKNYKTTQQKLQNSLELLKQKDFSLKESSRIAKIGYVEYNKITGKYHWSDYTYTIFGLTPKDKIPSSQEIINFFDKESQEKLKIAFEDSSTKGKLTDIELKGINSKNETFWIRQVAQPIFNDDNEFIGRRGLLQDITSYKTTELKLENSKKEIQNSLKLLAESEQNKNQASKFAKIGFHEYYNETKKFHWSEYVYTIFGLDQNQKIPKFNEMLNLFFEKSKNKLIKAIEELETYGLPYELELKLKNYKNKIIWVRISNNPIYSLNKTKIIGRRGIIQNITERKKIEQENLKIKNNYINLFDNATISIWNEDLTLLYLEINKLKKQNISDIKNYLENNFNILIKLKDKIKVNYVNKATVKLFKAENQLNFLNNIHSSFGDGAEKVFLNMIIAIWNNEDTFTSEANFKTLDGNQFTAIISAPIPKTIEEQKTVPVSIQSIQSIKEAEFALKESLNNLNEAQKLGRLGNFEVNPITQKFIWSDEIFNIFGFDKKNGYPSYQEVINLVHPEDREKHDFYLEQALAKGIPFDIEFRIITPKKEEKTIRTLCTLYKDKSGNVIKVKGINQDVTEQKKIIDKIKKTQEMYSLVTDNTNDLICLHDKEGNIIFMSHSIKRVLGYDNVVKYDLSFINIIHYDDQEKIKEHIKLTSKDKNYRKFIDFRARHIEGHFIWFEAHTSLAYKEENKTYFVTIARDISESVKVKNDLKEYQKSLQELTTEITLVEEQQKKEIASNIHDHLSQALVISNMKIAELKVRENLNEINEELNFIEDHVTEALNNSRKITSELSPPILYQLGLKQAVYWLLDKIETQHKIKCVVQDYADNFKLNDVESILMYRSIQEIINNTIKYAEATLIEVEFDNYKSNLQITIKDNGVGFDVSQLNNLRNKNGSGFGLFTVKERISNIKGDFKLSSKKNKGTTINIIIPLSNE